MSNRIVINQPTNVRELLDYFVRGEPVLVKGSKESIYGKIDFVAREDDSGLSFNLHIWEHSVTGKQASELSELHVRFEE